MKQIVIIGGGLGGLSSGALLAKEGYRVTLLEQHYVPGGCATTFKRPGGFKCEVGLHEMDGVYSSKAVRSVFNALHVYDHMEFVKPKEFFSHHSDTLDFDMPSQREMAILKLIACYPAEEQGIRAYFDLIKTIHDKIEQIQSARWWEYALFPFLFYSLIKYRHASVKEVMDTLFDNEELKLLLNTNVQYYHDKISEMSFIYHAIAQHSFYDGGGYFIKGGSQVLSDYLASVIMEHGGEVILRAEVTNIVVDSGTVTSVSYRHKREHKKIETDLLISNISPAQTYAMAGVSYRESKKLATSLLSVYIGFNRDMREVYGKKPYTTFFLDDINTIDAYDAADKSIEDRGFTFTDYSQVDAGLTPIGKSFAVICSVDTLSAWEGMSDQAYQTKKEHIVTRYLQRLEELYPGIQEHVAFAEVGTAKTMQRYLKTPAGTAYGFAPTAKQAFRIPQVKSNKIDNLYFVGAWVVGGGFSAAIISAKMCYDKIHKI